MEKIPIRLICRARIRGTEIFPIPRMNIQSGDGIGVLSATAFNMIKPILPKMASTIGLAGLSTGVSHGINKALKRDTIIKLNEKQVNEINKNLKKNK